jgi:aspartate aminotransferase
MIKPAKKMAVLEESPTLAITAKANELRASGRDVIGFGAGEPDFDTPENIKKAAIRAIEAGKTKYTPVGGIKELKEAIALKFREDNRLEYSADEIIVSSGGKHSLYNLFQALLDPGDEVVIPAPYWVSYPPMVTLAGGVAKVVPTDETTLFKLTPGSLEANITKRTRAVIINSPSNPTGSAYTEAELGAIADVALHNKLTVVTDEIYERLVYDGFKSTSIASLSEEMKQTTVVFNGVSKTYAMTGGRIGYAAGPAEIIKAMTKIQSQSTSNPASISQWAALEALTGPQEFVEKMIKEFSKRRKTMVSALNSINGVSSTMPAGAFYAFANISGLLGKNANNKRIKGSVDLAAYLIDNADVAVVPGAAFGDDNHIRLSYATSTENIAKGLERIAEAAAKIK